MDTLDTPLDPPLDKAVQDWFDKFEFLQFEVHIHYLCLIHYAHISD